MRNSLASLLLSLPDDIQRAAILDYLRRLHGNGETARLRAVFAHIRRLKPYFALKADAVHLALLFELRLNRTRQALALYRALRTLEARADPRGCRRADALWHLCRVMLPDAATRLGDLWRALGEQPLGPQAHYLRARSGLLLLEAACGNHDRPTAEAIRHDLRRLTHPACRDAITAAEARFQAAFPQ